MQTWVSGGGGQRTFKISFALPLPFVSKQFIYLWQIAFTCGKINNFHRQKNHTRPKTHQGFGSLVQFLLCSQTSIGNNPSKQRTIDRIAGEINIKDIHPNVPMDAWGRPMTGSSNPWAAFSVRLMVNSESVGSRDSPLEVLALVVPTPASVASLFCSARVRMVCDADHQRFMHRHTRSKPPPA